MIGVWDFILNLDDDISMWPERRKRFESSPIKLKPSDLLPNKGGCKK